MFGVTMKGKPYCRCTATRADYAVPSVAGHPPTYAVREERVLAAVDAWLDELTDPDRLDSTVATIVDADEQAEIEPAEITRARHQRHHLETELERLLAAIRAGMNPVLAAGATRKVQAELRSAECLVEEWERSQGRTLPLGEAQVRAALAETSGLVRLLAEADRAYRTDLYQALGIQLRYEREGSTGRERVHARSTLRSGGGNRSLAPFAPQRSQRCS